MITNTNHMSPTNKEGSLDMFHNKKNMEHHRNSSHNRGRNHPTEGHVYMGNEHHDEANMGHNQSIDMNPLSLSLF
jgi:hypothetical protein